MSQIINITITSSGPDLGPYNLFLVDALNNVSAGPTNIPKSLLVPPGYTFVVNDNILKVRLQSVNAGCPYVEFNVPPPPPTTTSTTTTTLPTCACYYVEAAPQSLVSWVDCNGNPQEDNYISTQPGYCALIGTLVADDPNAIIYGGTLACVDGACPTPPPCQCLRVTNVNSVDTTISYLSCDGVFYTNVPLFGNQTNSFCGSNLSSPGDIEIFYGDNCIDGEGEKECPAFDCTKNCNCITFTSDTNAGDVVSWFDCNGGYHTYTMGDHETFNICGSNPFSPTEKITITIGSTCVNIEGCECQPTTTTTSTTTTTAPPCNCYTVTAVPSGPTVLTYINCQGISTSLSLPQSEILEPPFVNFCAQQGTIVILPNTNIPVDNGLCVYGTPCNPTTTSTSTTTTTTTTVAPRGCATFSLAGGSGAGRTFNYIPCGQTQQTSVFVPGGDEFSDCIKLPYFAAGATNTGLCSANAGLIEWNINGIVGGNIKIIRNIDNVILVNTNSNTINAQNGLVNTPSSASSYTITSSVISGSGNNIKMRICNLNTLTEYSYDFGSGIGTSLSQVMIINPGDHYVVNVTIGNAISPPCPI